MPLTKREAGRKGEPRRESEVGEESEFSSSMNSRVTSSRFR